MIESLHKQADEEIIPKRVTGGLFDYYGIVPKEEKQRRWEDLVHSKFEDIIFWHKIFCQTKFTRDQDFYKFTRDLKTSNTV